MNTLSTYTNRSITTNIVVDRQVAIIAHQPAVERSNGLFVIDNERER